MVVVGAEFSTPALDAPTDVRAERQTMSSVAIAWDPVDDLYIDHYTVYRSALEATGYVAIKNTAKLHYIDRFLDDAVWYYKISVVDRFGIESDLSDPVNNITTIPDQPTNLKITRASGRAVSLTWDASTHYLKKKYNVYRSKDGGDFSVVATSENPFFTDTNLEPGAWVYKVAVVDKFGGVSTASATVSHSIKDLLPYKDTVTLALADTLEILDVETALGRRASEGSIVCLGKGKLQVEFSYDGTTYDTPMWLRREDHFNIASKKDFMEVSKIRVKTDLAGTQFTLSVI